MDGVLRAKLRRLPFRDQDVVRHKLSEILPSIRFYDWPDALVICGGVLLTWLSENPEAAHYHMGDIDFFVVGSLIDRVRYMLDDKSIKLIYMSWQLLALRWLMAIIRIDYPEASCYFRRGIFNIAVYIEGGMESRFIQVSIVKLIIAM